MIPTYGERKVQAEDVTFGEQIVEADILGSFGLVVSQLVSVVVDDLHAEHLGLFLDVQADSPQAEDAQDLALRIVAERRGRDGPFPGTVADGHDAVVEATEGPHDQKHGTIGSGLVEDLGTVGHEDAPCRTGLDVEAVIAGAHVGVESHALGQGVEQLLVPFSCLGDAGWRSVTDGHHAIVLAARQLLKEFSSVGGLGGGELGDFRYREPCVVRAVKGRKRQSRIRRGKYHNILEADAQALKRFEQSTENLLGHTLTGPVCPRAGL